MTKLYIEKENVITLFGEYDTDQEARKAIIKYYEDINFKSYYWNCYQMPAGSGYDGGIHIDFGSYSTFFIIKEEK